LSESKKLAFSEWIYSCLLIMACKQLLPEFEKMLVKKKHMAEANPPCVFVSKSGF